MDEGCAALLREFETLQESENLLHSATFQQDLAWRLNRILTPEALQTVDIRSLRADYNRVLVRFIYSDRRNTEVRALSDRMDSLENSPIGGGWV